MCNMLNWVCTFDPWQDGELLHVAIANELMDDPYDEIEGLLPNLLWLTCFIDCRFTTGSCLLVQLLVASVSASGRLCTWHAVSRAPAVITNGVDGFTGPLRKLAVILSLMPMVPYA